MFWSRDFDWWILYDFIVVFWFYSRIWPQHVWQILLRNIYTQYITISYNINQQIQLHTFTIIYNILQSFTYNSIIFRNIQYISKEGDKWYVLNCFDFIAWSWWTISFINILRLRPTIEVCHWRTVSRMLSRAFVCWTCSRCSQPQKRSAVDSPRGASF